jgi:hypothetical protein
MRILEAGALYFALVFGSGFLLGVVRTLLVEQRLGARKAELLEMPIMLVVTVVAARWTLATLDVPSATFPRVAVGFIALLFLLAAEFGLVLRLRHLSVRQYLASRDPVSGTAYYLMLLVFALMPLLIARC